MMKSARSGQGVVETSTCYFHLSTTTADDTLPDERSIRTVHNADLGEEDSVLTACRQKRATAEGLYWSDIPFYRTGEIAPNAAAGTALA